MTFLTERQLAVGEDAGDTLHTQRRRLDSAFIFDTMLSYANGRQPIRWLAEGRDVSATIDSGLLDASPRPANFVNDGDNETTGIHMSNGDPSMHGILGALVPHPFVQGWSWFWTQQHGDNVTYEVIANPNNHSQPSWFGGGKRSSWGPRPAAPPGRSGPRLRGPDPVPMRGGLRRDGESLAHLRDPAGQLLEQHLQVGARLRIDEVALLVELLAGARHEQLPRECLRAREEQCLAHLPLRVRGAADAGRGAHDCDRLAVEHRPARRPRAPSRSHS